MALQTRWRTRRTRRGAALITTLTLLMGMSLLALGVLNLTNGAMQITQRRTETNTAFNIAESGIDLGVKWLAKQPSPPTAGLHPLVGFWGTNGTIPNPLGDPSQVGSTVTVTIDDDQSNPGSVQKHYVIEAVGRSAGGSVQIVRAYVEQISFGKYAFFTDVDPSNLVWVAGRSSFDGPVHCNNSDGGQSIVEWTDNTPIYKYLGNDAFTYGNTPAWYYNNPSNQSVTYQPPAAATWPSVASYGAAGVHAGTPITLPTISNDQEDAALGLPKGTPIPAPPLLSGVTVTPGGGVFIHSGHSPSTDVQQMAMSLDGQGNQVITIQQNDDTGTLNQTQITLDKGSNTTHVQSGPQKGNSGTFKMTAQPDVAGVTNGVIYSDGNIGSTGSGNAGTSTPGQGLSGTIADNQALTIAVDATKNVNVNGSVVYNTARARDGSGNLLPESDPANATFLKQAGTLGIVANSVQLVDNDSSGKALGDLELDATVMAYNTLTAVDYGTRNPHKFLCMGGEVAKQRGALGQFNPITLQVVSGYSGTYSYDNRLANTPPPFFPTTGSHYDVISWQRVTSTL